jgi:hypothetical protein
VIDGAVHGNPREPGPHFRARFEAAELRVHFHPGVLHDVPGVLGIPGQPVDDPEQIAAVLLDEHTKGVHVAFTRSGDNGCVALVHAYGLRRRPSTAVGFVKFLHG